MSERIGKYLSVELVGSTGKTKVWRLLNENGGGLGLGFIEWYSQWRQYVLRTESVYTIFNRGCLQEIDTFLKKQNDEHRAECRARRKLG